MLPSALTGVLGGFSAPTVVVGEGDFCSLFNNTLTFLILPPGNFVGHTHDVTTAGAVTRHTDGDVGRLPSARG